MSGYDKSPDYSGATITKRGFAAWIAIAALLIFGLLFLFLSPAKSDEQLCPKYGECVSARFFECVSIDQSGVVTRVCYNNERKYMIIGLKGHDYHYCDVGADIVAALLDSESMGSFYNQSIKDSGVGGLYSCRDKALPLFE